MNLIYPFSTDSDEQALPQAFPSPFNNQPHGIAKLAAAQLQTRLASGSWRHDFEADDGGRMFGVLVLKDANGRLGYLAAFAGRLAGLMQAPDFVPPLFDQGQESDKQNSYRLSNRLGEEQVLSHFFTSQVPDGAGDCAAPKLLDYAHRHGLMPVALAEFWWGASPSQAVRHHGHFYPACRSKCHPILPFMLRGLELQPQHFPGGDAYDAHAPDTVYEDDELVVVNKPAGLLSVPGKEVEDSVLTRLRLRYPDASGPLLVHRLDMSTSGLLLAAKTAASHKTLQQQFEIRSVEKRYQAILSKRLPEQVEAGSVELPLRVDLDDRPRQLVCFSHGRSATTHWQVIERQKSSTRVYLYPLTGRTHQLRLHAAHKDGLNAPIVGDELYGVEGERLLLHAERLRFTHPGSGQGLEVMAAAPF